MDLGRAGGGGGVGADCRLFERALSSGEEAVTALAGHAAGCASCREKLDLWKAIPRSAPALKKEWESPELFPRIARAISQEVRRRELPAVPPAPRSRYLPWLAAAAAVLLFVLSIVGRSVLRPGESGRDPYSALRVSREPLMTEKTLEEVEGAEARYRDSIEKLSAVARPRLDAPATALQVAYREKLQMLDSAIAECRTAIEQNRFNTHLRKELLAMYQEKQRTLQQLMKEARS